MDVFSVCIYSWTSSSRAVSRSTTVIGVASLDDEIYLLRPKGRDHIEVYDVNTYQLLRCLTVPNIHGFADMTICRHYRCIYIADQIDGCVNKLGLHYGATRWSVNDLPWEPNGLSVNKAHNVLVTCRRVHGSLLRELTSPTRGTQYNWPVVSLLCVTIIVGNFTVSVRWV